MFLKGFRASCVSCRENISTRLVVNGVDKSVIGVDEKICYYNCCMLVLNLTVDSEKSVTNWKRRKKMLSSPSDRLLRNIIILRYVVCNNYWYICIRVFSSIVIFWHSSDICEKRRLLADGLLINDASLCKEEKHVLVASATWCSSVI